MTVAGIEPIGHGVLGLAARRTGGCLRAAPDAGAAAVLCRARGPVRRAGPGLLRPGAARGRGRGKQARRRVLLRRRARPASRTCQAEFNEYFGSMINMDDPRHARLRRIVSGAFSPRLIAKDSRTTCGAWPRPSSMRPADRRAVRFRANGRGQAAAQDHLRHDGHPG